MRKKVNDKEKIIISQFFKKLINIEKYDNDIIKKYSSLVKPNDDGSILEVINDYYLEENEFELLKQSPKYLEKNYSKVLLINDELNSRYYVKTNPHDTSKDNYVKNGSLVLKINKYMDYNGDLSKKIQIYEEFDMFLNSIETEISNNINVPVKILSKEIELPIKIKKRG